MHHFLKPANVKFSAEDGWEQATGEAAIKSEINANLINNDHYSNFTHYSTITNTSRLSWVDSETGAQFERKTDLLMHPVVYKIVSIW